MTNEETGESYSPVATGTLRYTKLENCDIDVIGTGRNLVFRPSLPGIFFTNGRSTFVVTAEGEEVWPFTRPGPVTDVCAEIGLH